MDFPSKSDCQNPVAKSVLRNVFANPGRGMQWARYRRYCAAATGASAGWTSSECRHPQICDAILRNYALHFMHYEQNHGPTASNQPRCDNRHHAEAPSARKKHFGNSEMPDFDVEAFIAKLDGMGMKLTVVLLADGRFRVSRWCTMKANEHAQQIQDLWSRQIGDNQERIDVLAAHLAKAVPQETARVVSSILPHVSSQSIAAAEGAPGLD
jgi:hypothetical protein